MIIGKVVGSVVSTRKNDNLIGNKFMIVEPIPSLKVENRIVAIDKIGAGIGEYVLVAQGSAARVGCGMEDRAGRCRHRRDHRRRAGYGVIADYG